MLTVEHLREQLNYDPLSGIFTWRAVRRGVRYGEIAGSPVTAKKGGWRVKLDGKEYPAAVLAFFYMTGRWPIGDVDHRDRDRSNNRWVNLREATRLQNHANRGNFPHSAPYKGVSYDKQTGRWRARLRKNGKLIDLGRFDTPEEARAAYVTAARVHFGEFARAE